MTRSISIWVQNFQQGALHNGDGDPEDRWPLFVERIRASGVAPDLVLGCEAVGWSAFGHRQLARAMRDLDMDACPLPPSSSGMPPVLFYRRETMGRWTRWNIDFAAQSLHGFGVATFDLGLPAPLAVAPAHLDPFSADRARAEAKLVATRAYRYGPYAIVGGDINYPPHSPSHPAPGYASMRPYSRSSRTRLPSESGDGPVPVLDRRVAEMLSYSGYVDAAWEL
ncbi:hypothetical protein [Streptomyces sp. NBC_01497]|uniref:hypothetical protein n=1 Tax=Streptomyces sp. NBC_01497 TaxID=2903885 RepID=UPI002E36AEE1|nr:hypothetical protein [Streptomyces sp. NBC_01497]